jgi:hypothetical protein
MQPPPQKFYSSSCLPPCSYSMVNSFVIDACDWAKLSRSPNAGRLISSDTMILPMRWFGAESPYVSYVWVLFGFLGC